MVVRKLRHQARDVVVQGADAVVQDLLSRNTLKAVGQDMLWLAVRARRAIEKSCNSKIDYLCEVS